MLSTGRVHKRHVFLRAPGTLLPGGLWSELHHFRLILQEPSRSVDLKMLSCPSCVVVSFLFTIRIEISDACYTQFRVYIRKCHFVKQEKVKRRANRFT